MTTEKLEFDVKSAFGTELLSPVHVGPIEVSLFENRNEIPDGQRLTDEQYTTAVNARIKAKVRADATAKALDAAGIKKPDTNDPSVIRANMVKMLVKLHGISEDAAGKILAASEAAASSL